MSKDPTRTKTLRETYAQRLRGHFGRLNAEIRKGITERDVFALAGNVDSMPQMRFDRDDRKLEEFQQWYRGAVRAGILSEIRTDENTYVRSGYSRGLTDAETALQQAGHDVPDREIAAALNLPVHQDSLQRLYTRNYQQLLGITEAVDQQVSRILSEGFASGESSSVLAREITEVVDDIGKRRATILAHTEIVNAHSEATLNRYEEFGVEQVTVKAEWATAADDRVCPICASLEGQVMGVQEAREGTFTYEGDDYRMRPPAHPMCRCTILPVVS